MDEPDYADDAPKIDDRTEPEELMRFVERRLERPHTFPEHDVVVWDLNSHVIDEDALRGAVENKLRKGRYVIPFQVTGAWTFMVGLLPPQVRNAEILIYRTHISQYYAYRNLYDDCTDDTLQEFRNEQARKVDEILNGAPQ